MLFVMLLRLRLSSITNSKVAFILLQWNLFPPFVFWLCDHFPSGFHPLPYSGTVGPVYQHTRIPVTQEANLPSVNCFLHIPGSVPFLNISECLQGAYLVPRQAVKKKLSSLLVPQAMLTIPENICSSEIVQYLDIGASHFSLRPVQNS